MPRKTVWLNLGWKDNKTWVNSNELIFEDFYTNFCDKLSGLDDGWMCVNDTNKIK